MTVDTQRLRECLYAYGMHRSTSIRMEIIAAAPALLDEIERLRTRLEIGEDAPEWDGIACRDETIRQQDAEIARLREALTECRDVLRIIAAPGWLSDALQAGSVERLAREVTALKRQARGALSPNPGDPTPTGVSVSPEAQ